MEIPQSNRLRNPMMDFCNISRRYFLKRLFEESQHNLLVEPHDFFFQRTQFQFPMNTWRNPWIDHRKISEEICRGITARISKIILGGISGRSARVIVEGIPRTISTVFP